MWFNMYLDADLCYDPYYQVVSPNGPNLQHCDFDGTGNIVFDWII